MSDAVVANRYAKALFDFAVEQKQVDSVYDDMSFFEEVSNSNAEFRKIMANPIIRHEKKLTILKKIFKNNVTDVTFSIFNVLTSKNREKLLLSIAVEFKKLYREFKKIQIASISTVNELTEKQREQFKKIVSDATNRSVELVEKIDESLIGGYLLQVEDQQIDTSVKKKLNELKLSLH